MKPVAGSGRHPEPPFGWREADYAALHPGTRDAFDGRVTENIFDIDDERDEIASITRSQGPDSMAQ